MRHLLAAAAILALATPLAAQESDPMTAEQSQSADLTFERVFASPGLDGASPRAPKLSPNGRYLTLLRNRAEERERYDLWGYDRETGEWTMLVDSEKLGSGRELSEDEKMQRERARVAISRASFPTSGIRTVRACSCRSMAISTLRNWTEPSLG